MQSNNLDQIRTIIKLFFNECDMEDIYNYIDNNISLTEIKKISDRNKEKFSIRERLNYSFVIDIPLEQQIQNFSDKSNEYLDVVDKILENRKNAIEVYNDEESTEEELLSVCSKLFLNNLSDEQIILYKESIIGIAINSDVDDKCFNAFLSLYNKLYNKYFAITSLIMYPATNPRGIAITDRYIPSFKIIFLICFLVVPIALNFPNS